MKNTQNKNTTLKAKLLDTKAFVNRDFTKAIYKKERQEEIKRLGIDKVRELGVDKKNKSFRKNPNAIIGIRLNDKINSILLRDLKNGTMNQNLMNLISEYMTFKGTQGKNNVASVSRSKTWVRLNEWIKMNKVEKLIPSEMRQYIDLRIGK